MFGDVADTGDHHHPGNERQQPQQWISPPHARRGKSCKEDQIDYKLGAQFAPEVSGALGERPRSVAKRIEKLRLALRVAGLAADIAPELSAIARPCDRKRC
jgi:hypothetical protein